MSRASSSRRAITAAGAVVLTATFVAGSVTSSWASAEGPTAGAAAALGAFTLGGELRATIDERSGALAVELPLGGLALRWDSASASVDRSGLGPGWSWADTGHLDVRGGLRVSPPSGGVYEADATSPTGLRDYLVADVRFDQGGGTLAGRDDTSVGPRPYRFTLSELGGTTTSFDDLGNPLTRADAFANRIDWVWASGTHLLERRVDPAGVTSEVDRADPGTVLVTTTAGAAARATYEIELDAGRVVAVRDPLGARTTFGYAGDGRLTRVLAPTGALTTVTWQQGADGIVAIERVRVADASSGEVVASRSWRAVEGSPSGWPSAQAAGETSAAMPPYVTHLGDGTTGVVSAYSPAHLLVDRAVGAETPSGRIVMSRQRFAYIAGPGGLAPRFSRPIETITTWYDESGAERSATEHREYDDLGRVTRHTAADGTVTETAYDRESRDERAPPVGLPIAERTRSPDGIVTERRSELTSERTAVAAVERFQAAPGDPAPTRIGRTEYEVAPDGFVTEERGFPQGGAGSPVVTTWERHLDRDAGTETIVETRAAGTPIAAITRRVFELANGGLLAAADELGNVTAFERDPLGRELARTEPSGLRTTMAHRTAGAGGATTTTTTRPDGLVTTEHRDVVGRTVRVTDNLAAGHPVEGHTRVVETREYPDSATESVTDAWGATTTTRRDVLGRVVELVRPDGLVEVTRYDDAAHRRTMGVTPTGRLEDASVRTVETLNVDGDVIRRSAERADGAPGRTTELAYDGLGRVRSTTDGVSTTGTEFDRYGNPEQLTISPGAAPPAAPSGASNATAEPITVSRAFDDTGTTTEQTRTRAGESRSGGVRVLDALGRTVSETDQAGKTTRSEYTEDGLLARRVTDYGQVTEHTYDRTTRRLTRTVITSPIGTDVRTAYEYDAVLGTVTAVYDPTDRERTEITTEYDGHGNPTRMTYPDGSVLQVRYDEHGRRMGLTDVAGAVTRYSYDHAGRLTEVVQHDPAGRELARAGTAYDELGRVAALTRGNGVVTTFGYTSVGQVAREHTTDASGATLTEREYDYDARGNLLRRSDQVRDPGRAVAGAAAGSDALVATTTTYGYDAHDQLIGSTLVEGAHDGSPPAEASVISRVAYESTIGGDLRRERIEHRPGGSDASAAERVYDYSATGELERIATTSASGTSVAEQRYDPAGNLVVGADGTQYTYNAANRTVSETGPDGRVVATAYWADGRRAELSTREAAAGSGRAGGSAGEHVGSSAASTRFYWDGTTLVNDVHSRDGDGAGPQTASYLLGAARIARTVRGGNDAGGPSYAIHDRHGNVTALTGPEGAIAERYEYDDYGVTTVVWPGEAATADAPRAAVERSPFAWQVGDAAANPFAYAGEYTDPSGAQHLQARTYAPALRAFTTADTKPLHNRYAYADLNPIMRIDPSGHESEMDWTRVMQEPATKIVNTVLAIALTVFGFLGMNFPFSGAPALMVWGFWGGLASALVQTAGTALLTIDTVNSLVERPFMDASMSGKVQFSGNVVSNVGAIFASGFKLMRKAGIKRYRAQTKGQDAEIEILSNERSALSGAYTQLQREKTVADRRLAALEQALRDLHPDHPLIRPLPGTGAAPTAPHTLVRTLGDGADAVPAPTGARPSAYGSASSLLRRNDLPITPDEVRQAYPNT